MQQDIQASLRRIENGIGTPSNTDSSTLSNTSAASAPKAEIKESFLLTGSRNENGKSLDFIISQNAEQIQETKTLIDYKTSPEKSDKNIQLSDFYQQNLPLENFVLENIIGQNFLVYNNETYVQIFSISSDELSLDRKIGNGEDFEGLYEDGDVHSEIYTVKESSDLLVVKLNNGARIVLKRVTD